MSKKQIGKLTPMLETIEEIVYPLTATEKSIAQRERNELKYNLLEKMIEILQEEGLEFVNRTEDGYIIEIQNHELGMIPVQLDIKIKDLDYPLEEAIESWEIKVREKREKELVKAKAQAEKDRKAKITAEKKARIRKEREQVAAKIIEENYGKDE